MDIERVEQENITRSFNEIELSSQNMIDSIKVIFIFNSYFNYLVVENNISFQ